MPRRIRVKGTNIAITFPDDTSEDVIRNVLSARAASLRGQTQLPQPSQFEVTPSPSTFTPRALREPPILGETGRRIPGGAPELDINIRTEISKQLPTLGAIALPLAAGPVGALGAAGLTALGAAGGEAFRQLATGESFKTTPGKAAGKILTEGAIFGSLDAATRGFASGVGATGRAIAKTRPAQFVGGKIKSFLSPVLAFFTAVDPGAARKALGSPSATSPKILTRDFVEDFSKKTISALDDFKTEITNKWVNTARQLDKASPGGLIKTDRILSAMQALKNRFGIGKPGVKGISKVTQNAITRASQDAVDEIAGKQVINLSAAIKLRQNFDDLVKFSRLGLGEGVDKSAAVPVRNVIDGLIKRNYQPFKIVDAIYADGINTVKLSKEMFGLIPGQGARALGIKELEKVQKGLLGVFKRGDIFQSKLVQLDDKLTSITGVLDQAERFATASQFNELTSGLVRIALTGGLIASLTSTLERGDPKLKILGATGLTLAATSPRFIGKSLRGVSNIPSLLRRAAPPGVKAAFGASRLFREDQ